jgi:hypothetical protein
MPVNTYLEREREREREPGGGGAKSFLRQKSFAAEILWQNFAAEFSLPY